MKPTYQMLNIPNDPTPWTIVRPTNDKRWCVLWLQGWSTSIAIHYEGLERMAKVSNMSFAMLDYAGHGTHSQPLEDSSQEQQLTEVVALYDELKNQGYEHIIVVGGSFGSFMAALLASRRKLAALVLRAPAIYPKERFSITHHEITDSPEETKTFRAAVSAASDLPALQAVKDFSGPTYVIEHELDTIIPKNIPKAYFETAKRGNNLVVPVTGHATKLMPEPAKHFAYIESAITSILKLIQLEAELPTRRD